MGWVPGLHARIAVEVVAVGRKRRCVGRQVGREIVADAHRVRLVVTASRGVRALADQHLH